jgi:hypothetical protein
MFQQPTECFLFEIFHKMEIGDKFEFYPLQQYITKINHNEYEWYNGDKFEIASYLTVASSKGAYIPSQPSEEKSHEIMTLGSALLNDQIQPKDEFITTGLWNYQMSTDHRLFITNVPGADPYSEFLPLTKRNLNIEGYVRPHPDNQKVFEPQRSKKFNLYDFLIKHRKWTRAAFGPGKRTEGVINHLKKELKEIRNNPSDLEEWIDLILIAFDGAKRQGHSTYKIIQTMQYKFFINSQKRAWPDWRNLKDQQSEVIEHIKS